MRYINNLIDQTGAQHIDYVGIPYEEWHISVVKAALRKRGKYLKKHEVTQSGCKALISSPDSVFIIDGTLNRQYFFKRGKKANGEWRFHRGHDVPDGAGAWRHCIGIKNHRIVCNGVYRTGISADNLHLDIDGNFSCCFVSVFVYT
jgi:hypothetical protein